jgi:thioredoxin 1
MMSARELGHQDFLDVVAADGLVLVDWSEPSCAPSQVFDPIVDRVAEDHPGVFCAMVDTRKEPELAASFGIFAVPTLMIFRDGILLFCQPGVLPEAAVRDLLRQALALDMEQLRRTLEEGEDTPLN